MPADLHDKAVAMLNRLKISRVMEVSFWNTILFPAIEWITNLPWNFHSEDILDITHKTIT